MLSNSPGPIGIFDSGYGGLTILHGIRQLLPQYDYLYLGDNARAPYGPRSFDVVYEFTRQAVLRLFEMGCHLVILGCNTASAKALRTIQQNDLPKWDPTRRVLGIIRPTAEIIGGLTDSRHVGVLATEGTIKSESYNLEIQKLYPDIQVSGVACPFWVPLVEYNEADSPGADYFVKKRIDEIMQSLPERQGFVLPGGTTTAAQAHVCRTVCRRAERRIAALAEEAQIAPEMQQYVNRLSDYLFVLAKIINFNEGKSEIVWQNVCK